MTRTVRVLAAVAAVALAACTTGPADADPSPLVVAPEVRRDAVPYHREWFGDYDRDVVLAANHADHPGCDGYYSAADDRCHLEASAVEVDHIVPLAEAWDSGAAAWGPNRLDAFGGDQSNLWLLTTSLNRSKGDGDPTTWLPDHDRCGYLVAYVSVKQAWDLAVDPAEVAAIDGTGCPIREVLP